MCHLIYCSVTEGVAVTKRASEVVCEGDRRWCLGLQNPYAKAPKINVRDFKRERRTSSPNEIQPMATVSN